jgi:prephenate dehydrogenase
LRDEDWDSVEAAIERAREGRRRVRFKGERGPAVPVTLEVFVPDRAGVLAELTTTLGQAGVNIEDLWMDHTAAGGVVYLVVDGEAVAARALQRLSEGGFRGAMLEER